jgi:hypothetical protein
MKVSHPIVSLYKRPPQCDREQRSSKRGVDQIAPAQGAGQQYTDELGEHSGRRPRPEQRGCGDREHGKRYRTTGIVALPGHHVDDHRHDPDHRAANEQERPAIIPAARQQRRIEGIEDRRLAGENCNDRHDRTGQANNEADPSRRRATKRTVKTRRRYCVAEAHGEEGGDHVSQRRAVQRDRGIVCCGIVERRRQRAAHQHLPGAQHDRRQEYGESHPVVTERQPLSVLHSSSFRSE